MLCCVLWLWIFLICFLMVCTTNTITRSQGVKESSFPWYSQTWNKTFHGLLWRTICKFSAPEIWEFHLHIWTYCCLPSGQPSSISKFSASFLGWVSWCHEESFWMRSRIPLPVKCNLYICRFFGDFSNSSLQLAGLLSGFLIGSMTLKLLLLLN